MSEFSEASMPKFASFDQRVTEAPDDALAEIVKRGNYPENQYSSAEGGNIMMFGAYPYATALERGHLSRETHAAAFQGIYFAHLTANYLLGDRVELPYPHDRTIDQDERRGRLLAEKDAYLYANPNMAKWIRDVTTENGFSAWRTLVFETVAAAMLEKIETAERQKFIDLESQFGSAAPPPEASE